MTNFKEIPVYEFCKKVGDSRYAMADYTHYVVPEWNAQVAYRIDAVRFHRDGAIVAISGDIEIPLANAIIIEGWAYRAPVARPIAPPPVVTPVESEEDGGNEDEDGE